jgi:hypothetical protein
MAIEIAEFTRKIAIFDVWNSTRISNLAKISPYSIFWQVVEVTRISNLAINSPYSIFRHRNFEYTGRFPYIRSYGASTPISDFTGRGHFVTYIRYSGTK